jgi:hypothetical protein
MKVGMAVPFILLHRETHEVHTGSMKNVYGLVFHGVKTWEDREEADSEYGSYLETVGFTDRSVWELLEVDEDQLRLYHVKLKNDPSRRLFLREDGKAEIRK